MMTSSIGNIFRVTGPLWRESIGHRWIPLNRWISPHKCHWSFDVFVDLRLSKRVSIQLRRRWFETPSSSLWRHCNDHVIMFVSSQSLLGSVNLLNFEIYRLWKIYFCDIASVVILAFEPLNISLPGATLSSNGHASFHGLSKFDFHHDLLW